MTQQPFRPNRSTLIAIIALALVLLLPTARANAATWRGPVTVTWYGPGFYWNTFACAGRTAPDGTRLPRYYNPRLRGVAHRTLPCGARVTLKRWGRITRVRVIDRGPFSGATFDLTARTAMDLCACREPYTMYNIRWRRGW